MTTTIITRINNKIMKYERRREKKKIEKRKNKMNGILLFRLLIRWTY